MAFTSPNFILFLVVVLLIYWLPVGERYRMSWQNAMLILSGMVFYAISQWYYLLLLLLLGIITFYGVLLMHQHVLKGKGNGIKIAGIVLLLLVLFLFKYEMYCRYFIEQQLSGTHLTSWILPLGISFFTFQLIGYWIDVYQENITPCRSLFRFMAYLFYFPKIMSGPIERVQHAMPYFERTRYFDRFLAEEGLRQFVWGLFKKRLVADTLSLYIYGVFQSDSHALGGDMALACLFFPLQLYADFSGYSDMALGISKLFGIRLSINFRYPFFAKNISDYWQRWHISLTSWMMDYVYTPMAFSLRRWGKLGLILSVLTTFTLVGIWHGPHWNYVVFGLIHGVYFIPRVVFNASWERFFPRPIQLVLLYMLVSITSVLLLSNQLIDAWLAIKQMSTTFSFQYPVYDITRPLFLISVVLLLVFDSLGQTSEFPLTETVITHKWLRGVFVFLLLMAVFYVQNEQFDFLYLKF